MQCRVRRIVEQLVTQLGASAEYIRWGIMSRQIRLCLKFTLSEIYFCLRITLLESASDGVSGDEFWLDLSVTLTSKLFHGLAV